MAGRHLGSRRFSEFLQLHKLLKEEFSIPKIATQMAIPNVRSTAGRETSPTGTIFGESLRR
jgi:hypothetical protein